LKISIFGLGYVGCVSLGCLAKNGYNVIGVDVNESKVDLINKGSPTIIEKDVDDIIKEGHAQGRISATTNVSDAVNNTDISFICVGTPSTSSGHLDMGAILRVAEEIGRALREKGSFHVVVIRSTVLPGTNFSIAQLISGISNLKADQDFAVVSNPEFLREGSAVADYYNPPYSLLGTTNEIAAGMLRDLYKACKGPVIVTDVLVAELIKYVNNAFHAYKIVFANEIGNICQKIGVDAVKLMQIFCLDTKLNISPYYLKPGFAYGGSCLPKDLKALRTIAHDNYLECPMLENIERSNEVQKRVVLEEIISFGKRQLGFLGLSFKGGTDDLRNSPIIDILETLLGKGYDIKIYDRNVQLSQLIGKNKEYILSKIPYISRFMVDNPRDVVDVSEILVIVNNDNEYIQLLNHIDKHKIIYDLVGLKIDDKERLVNYKGISWT